MYCLGKIGIGIYDNNMICDAINWHTLYAQTSDLYRMHLRPKQKHNVLL